MSNDQAPKTTAPAASAAPVAPVTGTGTGPVVNPTPTPSLPNQASPSTMSVADAVAADAKTAAAPAAPAADPTVSTGWKLGDKVYIKAKTGVLQHLHTGEEFTSRAIKVTIDAFVSLQLKAGKLLIHKD